MYWTRLKTASDPAEGKPSEDRVYSQGRAGSKRPVLRAEPQASPFPFPPFLIQIGTFFPSPPSAGLTALLPPAGALPVELGPSLVPHFEEKSSPPAGEGKGERRAASGRGEPAPRACVGSPILP